jgi:hypothetical protein
VEQSDSLDQLGLRVPAPQHLQQGSKKRALKESNQEAKRIKLARRMHVSLRERKNTPAHFHNRQPQTRPHALDDQRAEDLQHSVCDGVHATGVRVLVAVHVELSLNVRDVSVGHVALVKVFHEETETADAEDRSIEFQEETLFFGGFEVGVCVPDEGAERTALVGGRGGVCWVS